MATKAYLGYPPPNVRRWIEEEYRKRKTIITFDDESTEEYEWSGQVTQQTLIDAGIYDGENYQWLKNPVSIRLGTTVTQIGEYALQHCTSLDSVSTPKVTTVGANAFCDCISLTSVSMPKVTTVGDYAFSNISTSVEFENQTTSEISEWFGNWVFGDSWGPVTVACSDGSAYAEWNGSNWNTTVTSA